MQAKLITMLLISVAWAAGSANAENAKVRVSFGHRAKESETFSVRMLAGSPGLMVSAMHGVGLEAADSVGDCAVLHVGAGDVDALDVELTWTRPTKERRNVHSIWQYLLAHPLSNGPLTTEMALQSPTGQVARLKDDQALTPDAPVLTVQLAEDGTRGFSIGIEQLLRHQAMWLPEHDAFVTLADAPVDFDTHLGSLKGERTLDRVKHEPEATLAEWTGKWEDIGNPKQWDKPWQSSWLGTQGHLTGFVARHGSLYKFGIDRWASVPPDHASPHKFRFDPLWPQFEWTGQRILDGLPILVTSCERAGQRCEVEQIVEPLRDTPPERRGEIGSVLLSKFRFSGAAGPLRFGFRLATEDKQRHPELRENSGRWCVVDRETENVWLMIEPGPGLTLKARVPIADEQDPRVEFDAVGELAAGQTREIVVKLTSPTVPAAEVATLAALDFATAREATVKYWEGWLAQGAQFEVPEKTVNDLFRANLWHALMLPRFRSGEHGEPRIDLPYSNFAYGQLNADWPINQAVYVDYMIHGLRGYFAVANEEFAAMYHTQQEPDGRVGGYANWGVYSPGMLYAIAQNYLLSGDRTSFKQLLPASLKAMDWCLGQVAQGQENKETPGLIVAPLNDLTHASRAWAFPNAYFVAGLDVFARALAADGHPRAAEVAAVAKKMRARRDRRFCPRQRELARSATGRRQLEQLCAVRCDDAAPVVRRMVSHRRGCRRHSPGAARGDRPARLARHRDAPRP